MAHLYIIRGLPGSGKTTLARRLRSDSMKYIFHFEADMFFEEWEREIEEFVYRFNPSKLSKAHKWCQEEVFRRLDIGNDVVVSNTFSRIWEMQPYIDYCKEYGHTFTVITCEGNYGNVHDVPEHVINNMKKRWEKYDG